MWLKRNNLPLKYDLPLSYSRVNDYIVQVWASILKCYWDFETWTLFRFQKNRLKHLNCLMYWDCLGVACFKLHTLFRTEKRKNKLCLATNYKSLRNQQILVLFTKYCTWAHCIWCSSIIIHFNLFIFSRLISRDDIVILDSLNYIKGKNMTIVLLSV